LRIIGTGLNKVGITHVANAAHAHVLAMKELVGSARNAGKAYFITDFKPVIIWQWLNELYTALGYSAVTRKISAGSATRIGAVLQWLWKTFRISGEPPMTPFVAKQLSTHHYYDLSESINDFGYVQHPDAENGWNEMIAYFGELKA
jgi:nucleoside-diphosphate-sugar epimerase